MLIAMQVTCPKCARQLNAPDGSGGKIATCKHCQTRFAIPPVPPTENAPTGFPPRPPLHTFQALAEFDEAVDETPALRMTLAACPDCGELCSKRALACPHCGAPISPTSAISFPNRGDISHSIASSVIVAMGLLMMGYFGLVFSAEHQGVNNIGLLADKIVGTIAGAALTIGGAIPTYIKFRR
jgi:ribosomal protein L37AE/L43A